MSFNGPVRLRPKYKDLRAAINRKNKYGLSDFNFKKLKADQNNSCAICQRPFGDLKTNKPHVDHNHQNGDIRGLLCFSCNSAIGLLQDNPVVIEAALQYIKKPSKLPKEYGERL